MNWLEHRIPPPLVALICAGGMWWLAQALPVLAVPDFARIVATSVLALAGGAVAVAAVISFRRARTTINPLKPQEATALVTSGIFRFTRNPMYVGMGLVLLAWAAYLASAWALLGPLAFVLYINRLQILPEERALAAMFGPAFADYQKQVRRWF